MITNRLYVWDLTVKWKEEITPTHIINCLKSLAKKWGFQQEIGDTGYRHYQIRMSLIKKASESKVLSLIKDTDLAGHITPTTNETMGDVYFYVTKLDTRLAGTEPYTDKDPEPPPMTWQLEDFLKKGPAPWMLDIYNICLTKKEIRKINVIWDFKGGIGKSQFTEWLEYLGAAEQIPFHNSYEDISAWVCSRREQGSKAKNYIIDIPRGLKKDKLNEFYSGIESLKDGVVFDKRHRARKIRFDRPNIFIFTNSKPQDETLEMISKDRWQIFIVNATSKQLDNVTQQVLSVGGITLDPVENHDTLQLLSSESN